MANRPPFYRPPGSGPLHPISANSLSQLSKHTVATPHSNTRSSPPVVITTAGTGSPSFTFSPPLQTAGSNVSIQPATDGQSGYLSANDFASFAAKEPALGSPPTDGFALASTAAGVRTWSAPGTLPHTITTVTSAYTILDTDEILLLDAAAGAFTATLPAAAGISGRSYTLKRINSGTNIPIVAAAGTETIDGASSVNLSSAFQVVRIVSDGAKWWSL